MKLPWVPHPATIRIWVVATVMIGGALSVPAAEAAELIALIGGTTRTLPGDEAKPSVSFPIEFTDVGTAAASVEVSVTEVLRDTVLLAETAVDASFGTGGSTLNVSVADAAAFEPTSDYSVTLLMTDGAGNRQSITLTLKRPPASLVAGGAVQAEQFVGLFSSLNDDVLPELQLPVERGGAIRSLTARQVEASEGRAAITAACELGGNTTGTCQLASAAPVSLSSAAIGDGVLNLGYQLSGFPLGTTVRTVELRSPQLAAPVTVTFELTKRRSPFLIPFVVVVGLLAGLLVRKVLVELIAWSKRRAAKDELLRTIDGLRSQYADEDFGNLLDEVVAVLGQGKVTLEQIEGQANTVATALQTLNDQLMEIQAGVEAVADEITGEWTLPESLQAHVINVEQAVSEAQAVMDSRDAAEARRKRVNAQDALDDTRKAAVDWAGNYRHAAMAMEEAIAALSGSSSIAQLKRLLAGTEARAEVTTDANARAVLRTAHGVILDWNANVEPAIRSAIQDHTDRNPDLAAKARQALSTGDAAQRLHEASEPLGQLLRKPRFPTPGAVQQESARVDVEAAEPTGDAGVEANVVLPRYDIGVLPYIRRLPTRLAATTIGAVAETMLFLALSAIIAFVAYATAAEDWIGGMPQIAALFGWAFVLDVGVASAIALFGQQQSTPPTFEQG